MTNEEKELLLKDLCARLPYKVVCNASVRSNNTDTPSISSDYCLTHSLINYVWIDYYKLRPYLRSMSTMTEEEKSELKEYLEAEEVDCNGFGYSEGGTLEDYISCIPYSICVGVVDWLNKNKFDYRGLISKGLALEAPEEMYNIK